MSVVRDQVREHVGQQRSRVGDQVPEDTRRQTGGRSRGPRARPAGQQATPAARNEVFVIGRVSGAPQERELPSGDVIAVWRVVVDRPAPRRQAPEGVRLPTSDTLWCTGWTATARRAASRLVSGDVVEVTGALRQRYWRAGTVLAGRTEVEVAALRTLLRAPR